MESDWDIGKLSSRRTWLEALLALVHSFGLIPRRNEGAETKRLKRKNPQYPKGLGFWSGRKAKALQPNFSFAGLGRKKI